MMTRYLIATAAALTIGTGIGVETQSASQTAQRQGSAVGQAVPAVGTEVALVGCVEFEQDYRKRMSAGRGGVLGSGANAGDEFVLTNVRPADAAHAAAATSGATGGRNAAAGSKPALGAGGGVYTLTGDQEKNLKRDVGRQVEVVGKIENAGKRSTGADITDISDLPRIAISTWHTVADFCPAK
jgi:hypothetical protein